MSRDHGMRGRCVRKRRCFLYCPCRVMACRSHLQKAYPIAIIQYVRVMDLIKDAGDGALLAI